MHVEWVRRYEQPLQQQVRGPVGEEAIPFHLTQPLSTITGSSLYGLPRQGLVGSPPSSVYLIRNHMLQPLIEDGPLEDIALHILPCYATE
jgi:hypothetical protein